MSALSTAEELKATANSAFSAKEFTKAQADYSKALCLAGDTELDLKATLFQNRAAAFLALNNYGAALQDSDAALALDPSREKAIYRRAQALEGLGKTGDALKDLKDLVSSLFVSEELWSSLLLLPTFMLVSIFAAS
jgi:tetratricopeptide (TPR) repeat protein